MDEISVVHLCKDREKLIKSLVHTRYSLAEAHCKYYQSFYGVALALRLFLTTHSSDSSPFLITYPKLSKHDRISDILVPNSMYLHHMTPSPSITHQANSGVKTLDSLVSCRSSKKEKDDYAIEMKEEDIDDNVLGGRGVCEHFYDPPVTTQNDQLGWDFFNLFDDEIIREELLDGISDKQQVVEKQGEEKVEIGGGVDDGKVVSEVVLLEEKEKLKEFDKPTGDGELLEALKDVEDLFMKAYESGVELSKMLDTNMIHMQPAFQKSKGGGMVVFSFFLITHITETMYMHLCLVVISNAGNSNKLIKSVTRSKSILSPSTSSRSSTNSLTWEEFSSNTFEEYGAGGMESGSHSSTLERLYAWEKKLYEEMKVKHNT